MPRRRKAARAFQPAKKHLTREQTVEALLADPWGVLRDEADHELLTAFSPAERKVILRDVDREEWHRREAAREPILRDRLRTTGPACWGEIFSERPDLEDELTPEQLRSRSGQTTPAGPQLIDREEHEDGDE